MKIIQMWLGHSSMKTTVDIRNPNTMQLRKQPTETAIPGYSVQTITARSVSGDIVMPSTSSNVLYKKQYFSFGYCSNVGNIPSLHIKDAVCQRAVLLRLFQGTALDKLF